MNATVGVSRALARTWRGAWAEAWANPRGFWAQVGIMAVNDLVWVVFWWLFFRQVPTVRGWGFDGAIMLLAMATTAVGVSIGALANTRWLGTLATNGQLDAALALPVPTLPYLLCRRVEPANVGDIGFGLALFLTLAHPTPLRAAVFLAGSLCAAAVLTGFLVAVGSTALWTGPNPTTDLGFQAVILFTLYPVDTFGAAVRFLLYGVLPAAFVSSVPAQLVGDLRLVPAVVLATVAAGWVTVGWVTFNRGLRHYTSGATWTDA